MHVAFVLACVGSGCASAIATPPLASHRASTPELELRFAGFEPVAMGLKQLQLATVRTDRLPPAWHLSAVYLTRAHGAPCASGISAGLLDTSAGRTGEGEILVQSAGQLSASFGADEAEDVCEAPCRLDIAFEDHARALRCVTMQLTE